METKYFNDGVIGNKKIKASFTKKGELIRLFYGLSDYKQMLDTFHVGLKVNDSANIYLHNDVNNVYSQNYEMDTNILETEIYNTYFNFRVSQTDYVPINKEFLIKNYVIKNESKTNMCINLLVYSKMLTNINNDTSGFIKSDALIQYNHDFSVCTFSNQKLYKFQVNGASNDFMSGKIGGKDYIGMSSDSAISYDLKEVKPGEEVSISLYVYINDNKEKSINKIETEINKIKKINEQDIKEETKKYWKNFVKNHDKLGINKSDINEKIKKIFNRSVLLFDLLTNDETGGISAGFEVDEGKTKCGRYSYCWPRDAVFITKALDIVKMEDISDKFYSKFCKMTQSKNGMWEQRFYTDGQLAPCWGYQIDETASVIYGVYDHFKTTKNKKFLKNNLKMLETAIKFLKEYIDDILDEKFQMQKSYDLWEEFEGYSLYSISAIYGAFSSMIKIYSEVKKDYEKDSKELEDIKKEEKILKNYISKIKDYSENTFFDEEKKSYVRNMQDKKIDISLLGTLIPFSMFEIDNEKTKNMIEKINLLLRTFTGGYIRYEGDGYMGGYNPWPIATLWMAWYYLEVGDVEKALELFVFVTNSASGHGFLGEQVNNETMKPNWVIGLTWSHAMYIIILEKLIKKDVF